MREVDYSGDVRQRVLPIVLGESVLFEHIEREDVEHKIGSLFVPPTAETRVEPERFRVLAVGPGRLNADGKYVKVQVEVGDVVVVGHPGTELRVYGETFYVANQNNIIAVLPE